MFWRKKRKNLPHLKIVNGWWEVISHGDSLHNASSAYYWVAQKNAQILQGKIFEQQLKIRAVVGGYHVTQKILAGQRWQ